MDGAKSLMENQSTTKQLEALEAYHQARTEYRSQLKAAARLLTGAGTDTTDPWEYDQPRFKWRRASMDALVHKSALALSEAYSRARELGCFKRF